jgi:hypothetical protein
LLDRLELVDHTSEFIGRDNSISINAENPSITAIHYVAGKRILLAYENAIHGFSNCSAKRVLSTALITCSVYPDKRPELLFQLPWTTAHIEYPLTMVWPRPDGCYWLASHFEAPTCRSFWRDGIFSNEQLHTSIDTDENSKVCSYSDDGWLLWERPGQTFQLEKYRFRPELKVVRTNNNQVRITWDEGSATDQLQSSDSISGPYKNVIGATASPVTFPASKGAEFFRLTQTI